MIKRISLPPRSLPTTRRTVQWQSANSSDFALHLLNSIRGRSEPVVVIVGSMHEAERLQEDLHFFGGSAHLFPDTETLPYDPLSPQVELIARRLSLLFKIRQGEVPLLIITIPTLMQYLPPTSFLASNVLLFKVGDQLEPESFRLQLKEAGYNAVNHVIAPGEYALRGSIFDLFPMGAESPIRIDLFDDEVDSIRTFDPETQETRQQMERLSLLPTREFERNPIGLERFQRKFIESFPHGAELPLYKEVLKGNLPSGIENYLPLFFDETATFFDYLKEESCLILYPSVEQEAIRYQELIETRYERYRHDQIRPLLPPSRLFLNLKPLMGAIEQYPQLLLTFTHEEGPKYNIERLKEHQENPPYPLLLTTESRGRREALLTRLHEGGIKPTVIDSAEQFFQAPKPLMLTSGVLNESLHSLDPPFAILTENAFLGLPPRRRYRAKEPVADIDSLLTNLDTLEVGDPIIHLKHGIGRYAGLDHIDDTELVVIQYQDNAKLYLPITDLDQLALYSGSAKEDAPWHRLGSSQWERARKKAAEKANDTAAELLNIYAIRAARESKGMTLDEEAYAQFNRAFPYETTPDQQRAIDEVIADLKEGKMDRIVCGDVGFGKTEVAMRAAFVAVMNGYQVAMLAPTTLLAEQHAQSFQDRFSDWPIAIRSLSRFRKTKETRKILAELADGSLDIVIGTHRLLSKDTKFHNLGLVIIDEEHRFGVRQKERLKALRTEVNFLAMTATPIPRTLNMGLSGLKSLSIIATPPEDRVAVKTFAHEWSDELLVEACMREFKRGGQVYFLHNEVQSIEAVGARLTELLPDITIGIAHGQMHERDLEKVMIDFYHHRINLLLCTTIIESGIDVPNANTVIINRADHLGLAQLHQIRGRVGRSHHRAYCYLILPHERAMTNDAKKRIEAVMNTDTLGAGFMLANHDLEIRGAGELLGENQSGEIHAIGFSLYMDLLKRAVKVVKEGGQLSVDEPFSRGTEIEIGLPALLQEDYIFDVTTRLSYYKKIASAETIEDLDAIQIDLIDRFGLLPEKSKTLFYLAELKILARPYNFAKIEANQHGVRLLFGEQPRFNPEKLIELIQQQPHRYQLNGEESLTYKRELEEPKARIDAIIQLLKALS